jgi:hypothetical protein
MAGVDSLVMTPLFHYEFTVGGRVRSVRADRYDTENNETIFKEWCRDPVAGEERHREVLRVRIDSGSLLRLPGSD